MQYTTGMGIGGGTLLSGWRGALFKEWTFTTTITAGSGLPLTPIYLRRGAGHRRHRHHPAGLHRRASLRRAGRLVPESRGLRRAACRANGAMRAAIPSPARCQFTLNASLARTFRLNDRLNLDLRFDATNALNHVTFHELEHDRHQRAVRAAESRPMPCATCRPRCG